MSRSIPLWLRILSPILVVGASIGVFLALAATKPEPTREERPNLGVLVETLVVEPGEHQVSVSANGTVIAAKQVQLQPDVGGRVIKQSDELVPGGRFEEGDMMLRIDARDYRLAVETRRAEVQRARLDLNLEKRRGSVAEKEWKSFGDLGASEEEKALALRKPQLRTAQIAVRSAASALEKSELDLKRTTVRAPFNAMVISENVEVGQLVDPMTPIATLVGTDQFWVQVSVPVALLASINVRQGKVPGSNVKIDYLVGSRNLSKEGEVVRRLPDLDPSGSMARVIVAIDDPMNESEGNLPLLLGSYVNVHIDSTPLANVIEVPRGAVREGNKVHVMNDNNRLEIRNVAIAWTRRDSVLVSGGLYPGERVVTSRISTPVPDMLLRLAATKSAPPTQSTKPETAQLETAE